MPPQPVPLFIFMRIITKVAFSDHFLWAQHCAMVDVMDDLTGPMCFHLLDIDWQMHRPSAVSLLQRIFLLGRLLRVHSSDRNTKHSLRNWDMMLTCKGSFNSSSESKSIAWLVSVTSGPDSHNRHPDALHSPLHQALACLEKTHAHYS